jgi:hypothetical protein
LAAAEGLMEAALRAVYGYGSSEWVPVSDKPTTSAM